MTDGRPLVVATFPVDEAALANDLGGAAEVQTVTALPEEQRAETLRAADVILALNWRAELRPGEGPALGVRFVQLLSAGPDHLPFDQLPPRAQIASNAGAYAEPMARARRGHGAGPDEALAPKQRQTRRGGLGPVIHALG